MQKKLAYKLIFILGLVGLFAYFAFPLDKRINLGLDLKGGMHLLLKVDTTHLPENARQDATD
ncbi:MAG: protein translocase subunit SecD, partial [Candidatus Omnitrophica bacterium]|nr:protein translocase subunit SecD [Candidatus Omnitrophota bacterium]